jgi:uncharacterized protein (TIGR03066 family)
MVAPPEAGSPGTASAAPSTTEAEPKRTPPASVVGNWKAPAKGGGTVELSLAKDGRFAWKVTRGDKSQTFDGQYDLTGKALVLEYSNGGTMVARVNAEGTDRFTFKMVGGPPNDPGLAFQQLRT